MFESYLKWNFCNFQHPTCVALIQNWKQGQDKSLHPAYSNISSALLVLQLSHHLEKLDIHSVFFQQDMKNSEPDFYACLTFDCFLKNELHVCKHYHATDATFRSDIHSGDFCFQNLQPSLSRLNSTPWLDFSVPLNPLRFKSHQRNCHKKKAEQFCKTSFFE